jgi:lipopolysaccharide/colanic/teichoic acid biosynthesis glycosyltransferase
MTRPQLLAKRLFDLFVASAGGLVLLVPFMVLCLVLRLFSRGPVFFIQPRIGRFGKPFACIKFRTMRIDAERDGPVTTAADDRITPSGRILRRLKIDELPQLWNVLIGNMSMVGPRPDVSGYADRLSGEAREILCLRPGITGPATLYFRDEERLLSAVKDPIAFNNEVLWPIKVAMNLAYLKSWSLARDIGFILITVVPLLNRVIKLVPEAPSEPEALSRW